MVEAVEWPYPWNAPRPAIESPYYEFYQRLRNKPLSQSEAYELAIEEANRRDRLIAALSHAHKKLEKQVSCVRRDISRRIDNLERLHGIQRANAYLINSFVKRTLPRLELVTKRYRLPKMTEGNASLFGRFNKLPDMSRADVELLAEDTATYMRLELGFISDQMPEASDLRLGWAMYQRAGAITQQLGQTPPLWDRINNKVFIEAEASSAIFRMTSPTWWRNHLRRKSNEWREHLQIALRNVSKKGNPYASRTTISEWREQKRRTREFLKGMELEDTEGNRISLIDKYDGSVANPAIRRCELMTRIRGFENICNQLGYIGEFYTLTAPSKYHATTKAGYSNSKWNGSSPADTQRYLRSVWERVRAKLHREDLRIFGIRVAEPHHDGTPHWHMLMFMEPENVDRVREILRDYAFKEDSKELNSDKARKARFHAEAIDPDKGSATGYVAKYISKNIDGYALDDELDDDTKQPLKEMAPAVSAWAARWRIRQFQFIGGAPVSVYRELRRMADPETALGLSVEFAAVHDAADVGDWAGYINAQGGPFVRRDDLVVRTYYEQAEDLNEYGEETTRIKGVFSPSVGMDIPIITRTVQWKIVPKRALDLAVDLLGAPAPSRSSVNNCTGGSGSLDSTPDITEPITLDFDNITPKERRQMLRRIRAEGRIKPKNQREGFTDSPDLEEAHRKSAATIQRRMEKRAAALAAAGDAMGRITEDMAIYGIELTRSEAWHMASGHTVQVGNAIYRGDSTGEIFQRKAKDKSAALKLAQTIEQHRPVMRMAKQARLLANYHDDELDANPENVSKAERTGSKYLDKMKQMIKASRSECN
ncbi:replication endonuclease [Hafnia alvei]|uniref:replication endonuclease n=1 Tax=Hafnia alvei TaxID=569 RepID=UPI0028BDB3E0|nr:replication endonuclease [Hafnia alvei]WNN53773.1 replication endonuclease [Hafnia alvei]